MPHWLSGRMYCIVLYCIVLYCRQWFEWWRTVSVWQRHHGLLSPHRQPDRRQPPMEMRWPWLTDWADVCIVLYCIVLYCIVLYCIVGNGLSDGAWCLCGSGITGSYPPIDSLIDVSHLWRWDGHASLTERTYVLYCIVLYCIVVKGLSDGARCLCGSGITGSSPYPSQPDRRQPPMEMR